MSAQQPDESQSAADQDIRGEIDALREQIKEGQPSILGAVRTLIQDYRDWQNGQRDFPRAALLGFVVAYLRPRIVLVLGSVVAVAIAGAQVWLVHRQNQLIEAQTTIFQQQTGLYEEQGRLLREQTRAVRADVVSKLLPNLKDSEAVASSTFLSVYGDVAMEILLEVALDQKTSYAQSPEKRNASLLIARNAEWLDDKQAASFLMRMVAAFNYDEMMGMGPLPEDPKFQQFSLSYLQKKATLAELFPDEADTANSRRERARELLDAVGSIKDGSYQHQLMLLQTLKQFLDVDGDETHQFQRMSAERKRIIIGHVAGLYLKLFGRWPLYDDEMDALADDLSYLCYQLSGSEDGFDSRTQSLHESILFFAEHYKDVDSSIRASRLVDSVVYQRCLPRDLATKTARVPYLSIDNPPNRYFRPAP